MESTKKAQDPLVDTTKTTKSNSSLAAVPMGWAVDIIPALRYLPDWCPGTGLKKNSAAISQDRRGFSVPSYRFVQRQMAAGEHQSSDISKLVEQLEPENGGLER